MQQIANKHALPLTWDFSNQLSTNGASLHHTRALSQTPTLLLWVADGVSHLRSVTLCSRLQRCLPVHGYDCFALLRRWSGLPRPLLPMCFVQFSAPYITTLTDLETNYLLLELSVPV